MASIHKVWLVLGATLLAGCNCLFPYAVATDDGRSREVAGSLDHSAAEPPAEVEAGGDHPVPVDLDADLCPPASGECWDIGAQFFKTDFNVDPPMIFSRSVLDDQPIRDRLGAEEDTTYKDYDVYCIYGGPHIKRVPLTWHIERKRLTATRYRVLVRGVSDVDCGKGAPRCAGQIDLNPDGPWRFDTRSPDLGAPLDAGTAPVCSVASASGDFCTVTPLQITWSSTTTCGGCCACPDGAGVNIDVEVTRS